jgi:uncharacterized protein (DUF983 family)
MRARRLEVINVTEDPYGSLEPDPAGGRHGADAPSDAGARPLYPEAGTLATLARGIGKRCPRCGERDTFLTWFRMRRTCPRCEWRFEKEEGGYLGAMVLNYVVAIGLWIAVLVVGLVLTVPDVPVLPLTIVSVVVLVLVPLSFYPRSKTLWAAVEYLTLRSDPDYHAPTHRDPRAKDLE